MTPAVGSIMGFIYGERDFLPCPASGMLTAGLGTVTIFQYGAGTAGVARTLGKYMMGSGSLFASVEYSSAPCVFSQANI